MENLFVRIENNTIKIKNKIAYEAMLENKILSINLLKKLTKISPYLYEPKNETIQVRSDKNSWDKPRIKENNAEMIINIKIQKSKIK